MKSKVPKINIQLDHVTIRTRNLPAAKEFFENLFDLEEKPRPEVIQRIPGHWLFAGDHPLVHLIGSYGGDSGFQAEAIDHVGFKLDDYDDFSERLETLDIRNSSMELPEIHERRIFFNAPGGPLIEAVFSDEKKLA